MKYNNRPQGILLLEDGTIFYGKSVGMTGVTYGEIAFNTGMTGYQEIFTDPSYYNQLMVTTNAHIGNYGVTNHENESDSIKISGLICKNFSLNPSRVASDSSLYDFFESQNFIALSDVDTRALVSYIRDNGAMKAIISTDSTKDISQLKQLFASIPDMKGLELASKVSTKEPYYCGDSASKIRIAVLDFGIKRNILTNFIDRGAYVKVFPYNTSFDELMQFTPDGIFLSNGPGDPEPLTDQQQVVTKAIKEGIPLFGICLGHQIIALANGMKTFKMFNGHRGINHPVKNLITGKCEITSQNHGFAVDKQSVEDHSEFELSHIHLNDQTTAGIRMKNKPCFSVQYHPEASPGPHDSSYLFDQYFEMILKSKANLINRN